MKPFIYTGFASRVVFGAGCIEQLPDEVERLGVKRALILSTSEQANSAREVMKALGARAVGVYDKAMMHVPIETAEEARLVARELEADCYVTVGGGSTTGLGKAIALTSGLPILAVPTTYAGSEMTPIYGLTQGGMKKTGRDARVLPKTVIYDPTLTIALPPTVSAVSGMNAIAHCVEALYAHDGNPIVSIMAEEGIRALAAALPVVVENPSDIQARSNALYGAWLGGISLGGAGMALHHKLCHILGGSYNLPHADTHSIVLPHAAHYNDTATDAMVRIARALGAKEAPRGLWDLASNLGIPMALRDLAFKETDLERAAEMATESPYPNPRPVEYAGVLALLRDAYDGRPPGT
ncbi:MAG: maleylacetate reductase [Burkholderiales bacterium]